jgi:GTP-binding protein LepA
MNKNNIRNFVITAHIDHGKSTLADRLLEITGTVEKRLMKPQYLDQLELERERGITIKMAPVRMAYSHPARINADQNADKHRLLYEEITYKIRGALFNVYNHLGPSYKENIYGNAIEEELRKSGLPYEREKTINVIYDGKPVGVYRPDFIIADKVILELKAQPFIGQLEIKQTWHYLKGSHYRLALLVNFGSKELQIERIIYDAIRDDPRLDQQKSAKVEQYVLNLIDTPGHSDFAYEVSRALAAVEGAVLLVDAVQGIQAQTLANFENAKRAGLKILGAVNKIDVAQPEQIENTAMDLAELIGVGAEEILRVSGKTGEGIPKFLEAIIKNIPPPHNSKFLIPNSGTNRALVFDSLYDEYKGVIAFVRVFDGEFSAEGGSASGGKILRLLAANIEFKPKEIGYFSPNLRSSDDLRLGEIGYIATGIKDPDKLKIGDTIISVDPRFDPRESANLALPGYKEPKPVVFVSFYPEDTSQYDELKQALAKLRLTDSAIRFEPDFSEVLGRGFKGGFLGRLHFEIAAERLAREFKIETVHSFPSVAYRVRQSARAPINADSNAEIQKTEKIQRDSASGLPDSAWLVVNNPKDFPDDYAEVQEPMTQVTISAPPQFLGNVLRLQEIFRFSDVQTDTLKNKVIVKAKLPLADLIRDLDDKLKSVSRGFASFYYELIGYEKADVAKLEVLAAGQAVPGLTRILPKQDIEREARVTVEKLKDLLPKQQFAQAVQAAAGGRIIARETIPALKKLLGHFGKTGGDRTRKMKLWKKQQKGKKKLKELAGQSQIKIPAGIFKELLKK